MALTPHGAREFMCITTVGLSEEFIASNYSVPSNYSVSGNSSTPGNYSAPNKLVLSPDACWSHLVVEGTEHNIVYYENRTACLLNLPEDLRMALMSDMRDRFEVSPINCHIQYESFETDSYVLGFVFFGVLIFSMLCLLLTVVVYILKRELLTVPGMNLACLCVSHFVHYLTGILNLCNLPHYQVSQAMCTLFGFTKNFTILATFFWLNVMAFDIWRTVAGMEPTAPSKRKVFKWRRFLKYSLYGWGMPLIIGCTAVLFDNISGIPETFRPSFRRPYLEDPDIRCVMSGNHLGSLFLFNTGPRILVLIANIVFFLLTARVIYQTGRQTDTMRSTNQQQDRFRLYLKLFVVMGLAWSLNIIEYLVHLDYGIDWVHSSPEWFKMLVDFVTGFIGVAIYLTFGFLPTVSLIKQYWRRIMAPGRPGSTSTDDGSVRSSMTNSTAVPAHSFKSNNYHMSTAGRTPPPSQLSTHAKRYMARRLSGSNPV